MTEIESVDLKIKELQDIAMRGYVDGWEQNRQRLYNLMMLRELMTSSPFRLNKIEDSK